MPKNHRRIVNNLAVYFLLPLISVCILLFLISVYLSKTQKVSANVLLVEGWLPADDIKTALDEFQKGGYDLIVTTGMRPVFEGCVLYENGYLVFLTKDRLHNHKGSGNHTIEVDAFSSTGGENSSKFNLFVNNYYVDNYTADKKKRKYVCQWKGELDAIDSVTVQFLNDKHSEFFDRNLYVSRVVIDDSIIIPALHFSEFDRGAWDGKQRVSNKADSNAEQARNLLLSLGVDSSSVISVPGNRVKINRTLTSALAMRDWLSSSGVKVKGINIISLGSHARRTWMTYHKILDKKYSIGIISLPEAKNQSLARFFFKTIREGVAIVYYSIILIPYWQK
jgi:hypothetical protein